MNDIVWMENKSGECVLEAHPTSKIRVGVYLEDNQLSEDPFREKELENAYYWWITIVNSKGTRVFSIRSLDLHCLFLPLEETKKAAEDFYLSTLTDMIDEELAESKELTKQLAEASKLVRQKK